MNRDEVIQNIEQMLKNKKIDLLYMIKHNKFFVEIQFPENIAEILYLPTIRENNRLYYGYSYTEENSHVVKEAYLENFKYNEKDRMVYGGQFVYVIEKERDMIDEDGQTYYEIFTEKSEMDLTCCMFLRIQDIITFKQYINKIIDFKHSYPKKSMKELLEKTKTFYKNGNIKSEEKYCEEGFDINLSINYYENGNKKREIGRNEKDDLNGLSKYYHSNGNLKRICYYFRNSLDGPNKEYWKDGTLKFECDFKDCDYQGMAKQYYTNGNYQIIRNYDKNVKKIYHKNGYVKVNYKNKRLLFY